MRARDVIRRPRISIAHRRKPAQQHQQHKRQRGNSGARDWFYLVDVSFGVDFANLQQYKGGLYTDLLHRPVDTDGTSSFNESLDAEFKLRTAAARRRTLSKRLKWSMTGSDVSSKTWEVSRIEGKLETITTRYLRGGASR